MKGLISITGSLRKYCIIFSIPAVKVLTHIFVLTLSRTCNTWYQVSSPYYTPRDVGCYLSWHLLNATKTIYQDVSLYINTICIVQSEWSLLKIIKLQKMDHHHKFCVCPRLRPGFLTSYILTDNTFILHILIY